MGRELKFKAWNGELKKMSKPFGIGHVLNFTNTEGFGHIKTIDNEVLLQFTGALDKNKIEIYENDQVTVTYRNGQKEDFFITYCESKARFMLDDGTTLWAFDESNDMQVIGNRFNHS